MLALLDRTQRRRVAEVEFAVLQAGDHDLSDLETPVEQPLAEASQIGSAAVIATSAPLLAVSRAPISAGRGGERQGQRDPHVEHRRVLLAGLPEVLARPIQDARPIELQAIDVLS